LKPKSQSGHAVLNSLKTGFNVHLSQLAHCRGAGAADFLIPKAGATPGFDIPLSLLSPSFKHQSFFVTSR
jgi:hypothetical protein